MSKKLICLLTFFCVGISYLYAQPTDNYNAAELKIALKKLNVLGSVLYLAAHPDDENTAFLSYFSKEALTRTGYLSLTRGDGGQNLIGSEQSELLGIIRTRELLEARKIDGAEQFFTRAIDFGYSKSPEETLEFWNEERILSDVVWIFRKFRPDVIVTRFPPTGEGGHGQHTASAILAIEAFKISNDPTRFPEQLKYVDPWQPKRIYWNAWMPILENRNEDLSKLVSINLGKYNPLLGKAYTEIAAESRTMHKSQGFGASGRRGDALNYFSYIIGDSASGDLLEGVDLSWNRIKDGEKIGNILKKAEEEFEPENPHKIIPLLISARKEIMNISNEYWKEIKLKELDKVIQSAAGIWIESIAINYSAVPGTSVEIISGIVNRSPVKIILKNVKLNYGIEEEANQILDKNIFYTYRKDIPLPKDVEYTHPYWLREEPGEGIYAVTERQMIGLPENPPKIYADFLLDIDEEEVILSTPVLFRWTDQVDGEKYRPLEIVPKAAVSIENELYLFPSSESKIINVKVSANQDSLNGILRIMLSENWKVEPASYNFSLSKKSEEKTFTFKVTPPQFSASDLITAEVEINGIKTNQGMNTINYPHIPIQTIFPKAEAKVVKVETKKVAKNIGYIMGSGDNIPAYLEQLGYNLSLLSDTDLESNDLSKYDAIVAGVRAYNTRDNLTRLNDRLMEYVKNGGTYVVQYNVTAGLLTENIGPYPFEISRERITMENSPIEIIDLNNPIVNYPNKINEKDFEGWIQERGLYFPGSWDEKYQPILSGNDPGETQKKGGLLYAEFGKGIFIYTGYSFFRQLPAGVPGAYRLFINLISAGKNGRTDHSSN